MDSRGGSTPAAGGEGETESDRTPGAAGDDDPVRYTYGASPVTDSDTAADSGQEDTGERPTGRHSPAGTAPRAVLRPVPEGFPTPPPRPARPNRAPAVTEAAAQRSPRRPLLITAIAIIAVLVLAVAIGGGILAVRALNSDPGPAAGSDPAASEPADPASGTPSSVTIGDVSVTEVSTEVGLDRVGSTAAGIEPAGEFVVLTLEVDNGTEQALRIENRVSLETDDGEVRPVDREASTAHLADTEYVTGYLAAGESTTTHLVIDVPIGAEPVAAHFDFTVNTEAGEGTLPLL